MESFDWTAGDHAAYAFGDGELAVQLARAGTVAIDIETLGLAVDSYAIKAFSVGNTDTAVVLDPTTTGGRAAIRDTIHTAQTLVLHNSPFDVPSLVNNGLMRLGDIGKVDDTLVSARLAYPGERVSKSLGDASARYLGAAYASWKSSLEHGFRATTGKTKAQLFRDLGLNSPAYRAYSAFDVIMTSRLREVLPAAVHTRLNTELFPPGDASYLLDREQTINRMLLHRTSVGIEIDETVVDELKGEMRRVTATADAQLAGYGVDTELSRDLIKRDVVRVLDGLGALPPRYRRLQNGQPSADMRNLQRIGHPIVALLKERSQAERFIVDYADKTLELARINGRIHPSVNVLSAVSGRMSVGDPPLQQYPAGVRRMLRFDGPTTSLDWSSIEPVFIANAVGELDLLAEFEAGGDLYLPERAAWEAAGSPTHWNR